MSDEAIQRMAATKRGKPAPWMRGNKFGSGMKNSFYGKFGENHPAWKNSKKHAFHKQIRQLYKYRQWRSDIFTRDNFTCVLCGKYACYLEADHFPKRFIDIVVEYSIKTLEQAIACEELWNLNNGRTLCKPCHAPTKGRYKKT